MPQRKFYWTHNNNIAADVSSFIVFILPFSIKRLPPVCSAPRCQDTE